MIIYGCDFHYLNIKLILEAILLLLQVVIYCIVLYQVKKDNI